MRFMKFAVLAVLFALPASFANAGVMGSATLEINNLFIRTASVPDGGLPSIVAGSTGSATTQLNGGAVTVIPFNFMTNASPYMEGVAGQGVVSAVAVGGSLNALVTPGISVSTIASGELTGPGSGLSSSAASLSTGFSPTSTIQVEISFDGVASILETMSDPLGSFSGTTDFSINLFAAGDGTRLNLLQDLNDAATGLDRNTVGTTVLNGLSQTVTLNSGSTYTFGINQFSRVRLNLREQPVIPEPASAVGFGALLIVGLFSRRKRA